MDGETPPRGTSDVVLARKTHRKSRLGCVECKRRRVKCDEAKPACTNCRRRSTECSFLRSDKNPPQQQTLSNRASDALHIIHQPARPHPAALIPDDRNDVHSSPAHLSAAALRESSNAHNSLHPANVSLPGHPHAFDTFDLELWHHWLTVVCYTFADNLDGLPMWRDNIPRISFANNYVAQLILALSALHLARVDPARESQCFSKSQALQSTAISGVVDALAHAGNPSALWAASSLLAFCSFAKGPVEGQYLLYAEDAEPEWLGLLQGVKSILTHNHDAIDALLPDAKKRDTVNRSVNPEDLIPGIGQAFADLRSSIDAFRAEDRSFDKYIHPMDELYTCFAEVFERGDSLPGERVVGREGVRVNSHQVFAWLYRLSHDYLVSIQEKRPMALVILAHYLVLMTQIKDAWYMQGWVPHIMDAIKRHTHLAYQRWLEWPQSRLA